MAKISTYPGASGPQLSDKLIGTDTANNDATKNFTIAEILGLINFSAYVPYTGATGNVNLGGNDITANIVIATNGVSIDGGLSLNSGVGEFYAPVQMYNEATFDGQIKDGTGAPGANGEVLISTGGSVLWTAYDLQKVLDAGNSADGDIVLNGIGNKIEQSSDNTLIIQLGDNAGIEQAGVNAYIQQTGSSAYIEQTSPTAYIKPGQIKDSIGVFGNNGQTLVSLGIGLGVRWKDMHQVGSFYDSTSQTTTVGVAVPMKFGNEDIAGYGVAVNADLSLNKTRIGVSEAGIYNVQFSAQVRNGSGSGVIDIWFRKNGIDIPNSNTSITMQSNSAAVAAWNYFVSLNPGDILQIMWTQDSNDLFLVAAGAVSPHPATPSTILTVNRVR